MKGSTVNFIRKIVVLSTVILGLMVNAFADGQNNPYETKGLSHLGLTVNKLDESFDFFTKVLGWRPAGGRPDYPAKFVTNGEMFVTLWQATNPESAVTFDRKNNVGLHHLAIQVSTLEKLNALYEKLKSTPNVRIEFSPEYMGNGPTTHMMIRDPSGLRLEFIVHL